jgi:DNA invertase Pin-like site-specific DNA recombinase
VSRPASRASPVWVSKAQLADINHYVSGVGGEIIQHYKEVDHGDNNDRPELKKAMAYAARHKAELVVSKLDRLSRDVA